MPHEPFIWGAYGFALIALTWCALSPVFKARRLAVRLRAVHDEQEQAHASSA